MCYDVYEEMGWNLVGIEEEDLLCCDFVWVTWISRFVAVCVVEAALDIRVVSGGDFCYVNSRFLFDYLYGWNSRSRSRVLIVP